MKVGGQMTEQSNNDQHEEILIELIQVQNCLNLFSKTNIAEGENITQQEINALFSTLSKQVKSVVIKLQDTL